MVVHILNISFINYHNYFQIVIKHGGKIVEASHNLNNSLEFKS